MFLDMKIHNIILSGACKYEKTVKGMEDRKTNIKPITNALKYNISALKELLATSSRFHMVTKQDSTKYKSATARAKHYLPDQSSFVHCED